MLSVTIGPLAFPIAPLVTLAAIWGGAAVAGRVAGKPDSGRAENSIWLAAIIGLIAARAGYLVVHRDAYLQYPWSVLDIRDGGWLAWVGFLVAGLWLGRRVWRHALLRPAIASGALAVCAVWLPANIAIWHAQGISAKEPLPAVTVTRLGDGQQKPLKDVLIGKPAVVNLWATWCGPCRVEMPTLAQAQQRHANVRFVFLNQGENASAIRTYLAREGLNLQEVWLDKRGATGPAVGSTGLPTTLFFDATGRRVDAHFGVLSAASLRARVLVLQRSGQR